jgi:hydrogenase expression/formation protein HypC
MSAVIGSGETTTENVDGGVVMCLGVPGQIVSIEGSSAVVDFWGARKSIRIDALEEPVQRGDFVIEHEGVAVRRIPPPEVEDTLALYETILAECGVYA